MKNVKSSTIDRIKAGFAKKLFRKREVNKRRSGEKQKKKDYRASLLHSV